MSQFQYLDFNVSIGAKTASPRGLSESSLPAPRIGDTFEIQPGFCDLQWKLSALIRVRVICCFAIGYTKPIVQVMRGNSLAAIVNCG
jgi:hypothetical protein